ncbi:hypothetical protein PC120_g10947 [Phytophthora cactorum]|nr:hypothetical protein PC120_g10947 [Phytophthora cactorum]
MAYIMDFNSVWPLLRKEGWTWKPATSIQIHHNYLNPGRKVRGGKCGTDYFNGEDELLAYVRRDTDLSTRLNIANSKVLYAQKSPSFLRSQVYLRRHLHPQVVSSYDIFSDGACPDCNGKQRAAPGPIKPSTKKHAKKTPAKTKIAKPKDATKKTKKKTKKQLEQEAAERRRELSSFGRVWGDENTQANDGLRADPPRTNQDADATSADTNDNTDTEGRANADTTDVDDPADPDINGDGSSDEASSSGGEGSVYHFDGSDNADPDSEDEGEVRRDDGRVVLPRVADSVSKFQAIGFAGMEPSDPNLVLGTDEEFLDSDAEGSDDLVETAKGFVDDASSEARDTNESIAEAVSRMISLMKPNEAEELHLRVHGSSKIYDNNQLADMANDGWDVLPDDTTAAVTDNAGVDKMYDGYCGPSQGIIVAAKSPIELFFYFLPKALWRHVASESNRYWKQTFDVRLEKAVEQEKKMTDRPQKSREKLLKRLSKFEKILLHEVVP